MAQHGLTQEQSEGRFKCCWCQGPFWGWLGPPMARMMCRAVASGMALGHFRAISMRSSAVLTDQENSEQPLDFESLYFTFLDLFMILIQ